MGVVVWVRECVRRCQDCNLSHVGQSYLQLLHILCVCFRGVLVCQGAGGRLYKPFARKPWLTVYRARSGFYIRDRHGSIQTRTVLL